MGAHDRSDGSSVVDDRQQPVEWRSLEELLPDIDLLPTLLRERANGIEAAERRAARDVADRAVRERADESLGLTAPRLRQGPETIVVGPSRAVAGFGVADEVHGCVGRSRHVEQLAIPLVRERRASVGKREPSGLVHLAGRTEIGAGDGVHEPVEHDLGPPLPVPVRRGRELTADPRLQSRLLADLAEGCLLEGFAVLHLPLGERPVVVPGSVHEHGLDLTLHHTAEDAARRPDLGRQVQNRFLFSSRAHAFGQASRWRSRSIDSYSARRPAANATDVSSAPIPFAVSHARDTTAS